MILFFPIIFYLFAVFLLILLSNQILKNKSAEKRNRNRRWIMISASTLFPILGFLYFSYLFGIALEDHYDIKKGTFLWYATMDNKTIKGFPVFASKGNVIYNKIGGDSPNIASAWEIKYETNEKIEILTKSIVEYLTLEGYEISSVDEKQVDWTEIEMNRRYTGSNKIGESIDLLLQKQENGLVKIECSIFY